MKNNIMALFAAMALTLNTSAAKIETDRTWYVAGEVMTVNVTADDALIAYAELCDTQGLAAGSKINLHEGKGIGTIELPTDLHSGYYVLSVYTRHSTKVYQRLVAVVNLGEQSTLLVSSSLCGSLNINCKGSFGVSRSHNRVLLRCNFCYFCRKFYSIISSPAR